ncbi:YqaJ viral recombinase family protein [Diaphorobacter nitroreducens]
MIIHDEQQGTQAWHALRAQHFTASEAPAMMGASPYMTRTELLKQKALGIVDAEVNSAKLALFQAGHDAEASFRPLAEEIVGDDLYPITGTLEVDGLPLLASFDGLTLDRTIGFEHKLWSGKVAAQLQEVGEPAPHHYWQLEQQLLVSGAERILFATSDGTEALSASVWYESKPERRAALIAGWRQFAADKEAYTPEPAAAPAAVAKPVASLPVVFDMRVEGRLVACNIDQYKPAALAYIAAINTSLTTDQEFADAEADAKFCRESASKLKLAIEQALGQMGDINTAINTVREIAVAFDAKGLALEKLVKSEKDARREAIVTDAIGDLRKHVAALNQRLGESYMPGIPADFGGAVKGKRNLDSMRDAVATELARAKIAANETADRIQANMQALVAAGDRAAFPDAASLVLKAPDDLRAIIAQRVAEAERKAEADRERIRREEQERADREAREKLAAEERATQASIAQAVQQGELAQPLAADLGNLVTERRAEGVSAIDARQAISAAQASASAADTGETLTLGQLNTLLAPIAISAAGLSDLGFNPCATVKAAKHYPVASVPAICLALIQRLQGVMAEA